MPLTLLLRRNIPFAWVAACQEAFDGLDTALPIASCLALPDTSEGGPIFELACAASGYGLTLVLCSLKQVGPLPSDQEQWCLLSNTTTSLSKTCLLAWKHCQLCAAMLVAFRAT